MAVHFVGLTESEFLSKHQYLYRFTTIDRFIGGLRRNKFVFVNPTKWSDPYEKYYICRKYKIGNQQHEMPMKDGIYAVCVSGTASSEAYWKVYAPKEDGVRLRLELETLVRELNASTQRIDYYIGEVNYQITKRFQTIDIDKAQLAEEIRQDIIGIQQIQLMMKKRQSFLYENEVRIIAVPRKQQKDKELLDVKVDVKNIVSEYTLDPRLGRSHGAMLKEHFAEKYGIKAIHSNMFTPIKNVHPILLQ